MTSENKIQMINVDNIHILNPRVRNRKIFDDISTNIIKVGLKRPITVTKAEKQKGGKEYDLVCGQGRLEAFIDAGQKDIPAIIKDTTEEGALIMGLVENLARKQHTSLYLMKGIEILKNKGYSVSEIAEKIGLSNEYIKNIVHLINNGEERLIAAVEAGNVPINIAMEIASTSGDDIQKALHDAYENNELRGKKLLYVKKLIALRKARGKKVGPRGSGISGASNITSRDLIEIYQKEVDRKKLIARKAEMVNNRLTFVSGAFRRLLSDSAFKKILENENINTMPKQLSETIGE